MVVSRRDRPSGRSATSVLAALAAVMLGALLYAQSPSAPDPWVGVHPPMDRLLSRGIERAEASIAAGEFSPAIRFLDEVLAREEDYFIALGDSHGYVGVKETARRLIRELPAPGRKAYEAVYGPAAKRMLAQAIDSGDAAILQTIVDRYYYTSAGYEAALLLAREEADAGRRLAAALLYDQLLATPEAAAKFEPSLSVSAATAWLAAGDSKRAAKILEAAKPSRGQALSIAGERRGANFGEDPLTGLRQAIDEPAAVHAALERQWITFRGNAARNGETSGGLPHMRVRWKVPLLGHPKLESTFRDFIADRDQSGKAVPVASEPLAIGDTILVRTPQYLLAVDFKTGKRIWRTEPEVKPLDQLIAPQQSGQSPGDGTPARTFARRVWDDYLFNTISSDGDRVFIIRGLTEPSRQPWEQWPGPIMGGSGQNGAEQSNRLCAYDLATQGKLVWEIDGAAATDDMQGAFFLGAPLAVRSTLYALAEVKNRVYLVALDASTGKLQWRQQLVDLEVRVTQNMQRRLQSSMPSYDSGMLVCPIGAGVVVGVDATRRSLAWAYRYESTMPQAGFEGQPQNMELENSSHWLDAAVAIADGKVILTPPESEFLHCLDLPTGRLLWKVPRNDMLRLAGVTGGKVLLVGGDSLKALNLSDGKNAWPVEALTLSDNVHPSGAGFLSGGKYYLPLNSGEVAAIDVSAGKIDSQVGSRDGDVLGNLICHRGAVISANGEFLDRFDQVEVLRKLAERSLAKNANDEDALRTMGEIAFNEGRLSEAVDLLERAYRANTNDLNARDVLAECLASALDEDFSSFRQKLPLLKSLDDGGGATRMRVLRVEAQGLLAEKELIASADTCIQMYRTAIRGDELIKIGRQLDTTVSRWVQGQMLAIWDQADEKQRIELGRKLAELVSTGGAESKSETLRRVVDFFGDLPAVEREKLARAGELIELRRPLEAQQLLIDLTESTDDEIRREAVARIAVSLHEAGLHMLSAEYDRQLTHQWSNTPCLDGRTGREIVARWQETLGDAPLSWPEGKVEASEVATAPNPDVNRFRSPMWGMRWERCDSILSDCTALVSARGGDLVFTDSLGREFFQTPLEPSNRTSMRQPGNLYGVARGSLAVISLGRQIAAISTLRSTAANEQPVIWRMNLGTALVADGGYSENVATGEDGRPGSFRALRASDGGKWIGVIGPVTSHGCVFQDQRKLICVDAATGQEAWSRSDVPPGCDLFGDSRYVLAALPGETTARIYGTVDGRYLGQAGVPLWKEQLTTIGRRVIRWRSLASGKWELASLDPIAKKRLWRRRFEANSKVDVDQGRYVVVVEPAGRATIIDAADNSTLIDEQIDAALRIEDVHLTTTPDGFMLIVNVPGASAGTRIVHPLTMLDSAVVDGKVYMFDRTTAKMRWRRPAEVAQQAYLVTQPPGLPFVTFAGTLHTRDRSGTRAATTMLILDKATGRSLYQSDSLPQAGAAHCVARVSDIARHEAVVEIAGKTVMLRFTDARRPPEPPSLAEVESNIGKSTRGLMGIFLNLSTEK